MAAPTVVFTVESDNEHQTGWLFYILGLPKDPTWNETRADGWETGHETHSLWTTRYAMEKLQVPPTAFPIRITVEEPDDAPVRHAEPADSPGD
jgi:hypothetical protein